jgi:hypothetical protein
MGKKQFATINTHTSFNCNLKFGISTDIARCENITWKNNITHEFEKFN